MLPSLTRYLVSITNQNKNKELAKEHFDIAFNLFVKALAADPQYPPIVANWSVYYFYTEDFVKAKVKADEATKMGYQFSSAYLKDLEKNLK